MSFKLPMYCSNNKFIQEERLSMILLWDMKDNYIIKCITFFFYIKESWLGLNPSWFILLLCLGYQLLLWWFFLNYIVFVSPLCLPCVTLVICKSNVIPMLLFRIEKTILILISINAVNCSLCVTVNVFLLKVRCFSLSMSSSSLQWDYHSNAQSDCGTWSWRD